MSCDNEFGRFVSYVSREKRVSDVFGSPDRAKEGLQAIYSVTNVAAARDGWADDRNSTASATAGAVLLFGSMRGAQVTPPLKPPTHAKSGMPSPRTAFGYSEVYNTLQAIKKGEQLPASAANWISNRNRGDLDFASIADDGQWRYFYGAKDDELYVGGAIYTPIADRSDPDNPKLGQVDGREESQTGRNPRARVQVRSIQTAKFSGYELVDDNHFVHAKIGSDTLTATSEWVRETYDKPSLDAMTSIIMTCNTALADIEERDHIGQYAQDVINDTQIAIMTGKADAWNATYGSDIRNPNPNNWSLSYFDQQIKSKAIHLLALNGDNPNGQYTETDSEAGYNQRENTMRIRERASNAITTGYKRSAPIVSAQKYVTVAAPIKDIEQRYGGILPGRQGYEEWSVAFANKLLEAGWTQEEYFAWAASPVGKEWRDSNGWM